MSQSKGQIDRRRWQWPRFTIREMLLTTGVLAALWGFLAVRVERDELIASVVGSFVLVWGLICWKTVRTNREFFRINKRSGDANR
jgi:hypothetical protein